MPRPGGLPERDPCWHFKSWWVLSCSHVFSLSLVESWVSKGRNKYDVLGFPFLMHLTSVLDESVYIIFGSIQSDNERDTAPEFYSSTTHTFIHSYKHRHRHKQRDARGWRYTRKLFSVSDTQWTWLIVIVTPTRVSLCLWNEHLNVFDAKKWWLAVIFHGQTKALTTDFLTPICFLFNT